MVGGKPDAEGGAFLVVEQRFEHDGGVTVDDRIGEQDKLAQVGIGVGK